MSKLTTQLFRKLFFKLLVSASISLLLIATLVIKVEAQTPSPQNIANAKRMECELTGVEGLNGWSDNAKAYWREKIADAAGERINFFLDQGRFEPRIYTLHGNLAGLSSATLHRERVETNTADSDKIRVGQIAGTEIPVYEVKSDAERSVTEIVHMKDASYRLPVRLRDLPPNTTETVRFNATCKILAPALTAKAPTRRRSPAPIAISTQY